MIDAVSGRVIEVALEMGVFSELRAEPQSLSQLACSLGASERGLRPALSVLASLSLLDDSNDIYVLKDKTPSFLSEQWPKIQQQLPQAGDWVELEKAIRTGNCVRKPIEGHSDGGDFFSGIVDTLFGLHWPLASRLAKHLPSKVERVLDLGAGSAVWSLGLCTQREKVGCVAVDMKKVLLEVTSRFVTEKGLEEAYELRAGSYHEVPLEEDHYDVVYLGHIVHSEGWQASRTLIARCFKALKSGGHLVISEWLASQPRSADYSANLFDLNMLMFTENGLVFTKGELVNLCEEAGFTQPVWAEVGQYPPLIVEKL